MSNNDMETNLEKAERLLIANAAIIGIKLRGDEYLFQMLELAATPDVVKCSAIGVCGMEYIYTGAGATTGVVAPALTVGKPYKVIGNRDRAKYYDSKTISIRDDRGIKRWYSPLFIERSFEKK
jgi:hypothetical protein